MHVLRFNVLESNCVEAQGERYFFFRHPDGSRYMLPTTCPHRGGPLHLGCYVPERQAIECPWHKSRMSVQKLARGALPMVVVGGQVTVVVPATEGPAPVVTWRKTLFESVHPPSSDTPQDTEGHA